MKKVFILLVLVFLGCGCGTSSNDDLKNLMKDNEYIIVDVRTKEEYDEGHIVGAINIPYDEIDENSRLDKTKQIFVYCRSGARSEIASKSLAALGYKVYDLGAFSKLNLPKE